MQLKWSHQSLYAGFYAADQNGYYAEQGLAVTFLEGGSNIDVIAPVLEGSAQFSLVDGAQLILERATGKPLIAIGVIFRRSPLAFASLEQAGITRPQDVVGKSVRLTSSTAPAFHSMMARVGIAPDQYTEEDLPNDVARFGSGHPEVWSAYVNGFMLELQNAGYKLNVLYPDDYGVHFYADTIITTDELIATDPGLVRRFLQASLKGWSYAVENPDEAGALVINYSARADPAVEKQKMLVSLPYINTGEDHIGWMKAGVWESMQQTLHEQGLLDTPLDVSLVYTMQFLDEIYK